MAATAGREDNREASGKVLASFLLPGHSVGGKVTMDINEIVSMIPEDKREPVKAELASYVKIGAREDAEKLAREHPHVKSVVDSWISKAVQSHDERFVAEKLPSLVEGEILKRNPPKDPRDAKLAEMESKMKDMERQGIIKTGREKIKILVPHGLVRIAEGLEK